MVCRISHMPIANPRATDAHTIVKAFAVEDVTDDAFGHRRTTYVSGADECDVHSVSPSVRPGFVQQGVAMSIWTGFHYAEEAVG
ncbi:hypothetical protein GCM10011410_25740 [Hoyosella rhizosphaerae]|uniref:Uncharacterized protein n=1 Tax=Hoyosella rhizosphaerae TaxID=1755582 RepID=A0A916UFA5_9ACTN|nr:hypothetical protein GCM10011410_25740 [Hoyosella rhizosphaerae]